MTEAQTLPVIDENVITSLLDLGEGDPDQAEFLRELVVIFRSEAPQVIRDLAVVVKAREQHKSTLLAHKLKGYGRNLGASRFGEVCEQIETRGLAEKVGADDDRLVETLPGLLSEALVELQKYLGDPK